MKISWQDKNTVRWFEDASDYTGYHKNLAQILLPYITHRETLCDMGCGAGMMDFALSPYIERITCIDRDADVISALNGLIEKRGARNITAYCRDSLQVKDRFDTVIGLLHGEPEWFAGLYYELAKHTLIAVTHGVNAPHPFCSTAFADALSDKGIAFEQRIVHLEYGQPLYSYEDALDYVRRYTKTAPGEEEAFLRSHLTETGREDFPLYLPSEKEVCIFIVQK